MSRLSLPSIHRYQVMNMQSRSVREPLSFFSEDDLSREFCGKTGFLSSITDETLSTLLPLLRLQVYGHPIRCLSDIDKATDTRIANLEEWEEPIDKFSRENRFLYTLYNTKNIGNTDWSRLCQFLNNLDHDQMNAAQGFFSFLGIDIEAVFKSGEFQVDLPSDIGNSLPRQEFSGTSFVKVQGCERWMRESDHVMSYTVTKTIDNSNGFSEVILANAGTLEDALLIASYYVKSLNKYYESLVALRDDIESIEDVTALTIKKGDRTVISGKVKGFSMDADDESPSSSLRCMMSFSLNWDKRPGRENLDNLRADAQLKYERLMDFTPKQASYRKSLAETYNSEYQAAQAVIDQHDFDVSNEELDALVIKIDRRLNKHNNLSSYFIADIGV